MAGNEDVQLLHENLLKQHADNIKELRVEMNGIPQRLDNVEKQITKLCDTVMEFGKGVNDLLRRIEDKYQTKEMCDMCNLYLKNEVEELKLENRAQQKKIESLQKESSNMLKGIIGMGVTFFVQVLVWIFLNHDKLVK